MAKKIIKISILALLSLAGLIVMAFALLSYLLTPERLTPIINHYASRYLEADVRFDTVHLNVWEDFPLIAIKVDKLSIIPRNETSRDTLAYIGQLKTATNLFTLIKGNITIRHIAIKDCDINVVIDSLGRANYDIFGDSNDTSSTNINLHISKVDFTKGCRLRFHDLRDTLSIKADFEQFTWSGKIAADVSEIYTSQASARGLKYDIQAASFNLSQRFDTFDLKMAQRGELNLDIVSQTTTDAFDKPIPLELHGICGIDSVLDRKLFFKSLQVSLATVPITIDGTLNVGGDTIASDMKIIVSPFDLENLAPFVPASYSFTTDLRAGFDIKIRGKFSKQLSVLPTVKLNLEVSSGSLYIKQIKTKIEKLILSSHISFDPNNADSTGARVDTINLTMRSLELNGKFELWNVLSNPRFVGGVRGRVDFSKIKELGSFQKIASANGVAEYDLRGNFRLSHLNIRDIDRCDLRLRLTGDSLRVLIPQHDFFLSANALRLSAGSSATTRDSLIGIGKRIVRVSLNADTALVKYGKMFTIYAGKARVSMRSDASAFDGDSTMVHPMNGTIEARTFRFITADSTIIGARNINAAASIVPYKNQPTMPNLNLNVDADGFMFRKGVNRVTVSEAKARYEFFPRLADKQIVERRERRLDSLQKIYPDITRDSLSAHAAAIRRNSQERDELAGRDIDIAIAKNSFITDYQIRGELRARRVRTVTPYLPIETSISDIDLTSNQDEIQLRNATVRFGHSDATVKGKISNIRSSLLGRGKLVVDAEISADTLNFNEIIIALTKGATIAEQDLFTGRESDKQLQEKIETQAQVNNIDNALVIVPANVEVALKFAAGYGEIRTLILEDLKCELRMRNRTMQIVYLLAETNSGDMTLSGIYATRSKNDIMFGVDVDLRKIRVDNFIKMMPEIDSLYPMLRSLEGVIDCQMAATAALDTAMNIRSETLSAALSLNGDKLVLIDGETFAKIAKMLYFKNKKRNIIDHISVAMLVRDKKIEMYPFVLEVDRYRTAVSGVQNLDLSFRYHISVLKSPVPFRLGVDIFGTPDNWDYRIGKAQYRDGKVPSYITLIEDNRISLSKKIHQAFESGIRAVTLDNLNAASHKPDSLFIPTVIALDSAEMKIIERIVE